MISKTSDSATLDVESLQLIAHSKETETSEKYDSSDIKGFTFEIKKFFTKIGETAKIMVKSKEWKKVLSEEKIAYIGLYTVLIGACAIKTFIDPEIGMVIGMIGGLCTSLISIIMPGLLYFLIKRSEKNIICSTLAVILILFGFLCVIWFIAPFESILATGFLSPTEKGPVSLIS